MAGTTVLASPLFCSSCGRPAEGNADADPDLHEARFYERLNNKTVRCRLCPRGCMVPTGRSGYCRVRQNRGGTYYTLSYGRPVAIHNDPIEKKPFFHVLPGSQALSIATVGCNIECKFCQNWDISQAGPDEVSPPYRSPSDIAELASQAHSRSVAYTYSEPTIFFEYMSDCSRAAAERDIGNVVVSNGYISEEPLKELCSLVTAIKVDLKAFTQDFYGKTCDGELQPVLDTLERISKSGTWLEIVVLIVPTLNDGSEETQRMAAWIVEHLGPDVPLHFSRFHPAYKIRNLPATPPHTLEKARATALREGCRFVYTGNMPGGEGEHTACPRCGERVIERYGFYVRKNALSEGACPKCGQAIPGVWDLPAS